MGYRKTPPVAGFREFELQRQAFSSEVTLIVMEGSFRLRREELGQWLHDVRCAEASKVMDLLWNFRCVRYSLVTQTYNVPEEPERDPAAFGIDGYVSAMYGQRRVIAGGMWPQLGGAARPGF